MAKSPKSVKGKRVGKKATAKKHAQPARSPKTKKAPARKKQAVKAAKRPAAKVVKKKAVVRKAPPKAVAKPKAKKPVGKLPASKAAAKPLAKPAAKTPSSLVPVKPQKALPKAAAAVKPSLPPLAKKPVIRMPPRPLSRPIPVGPPRAVIVVSAVPSSAWGPFREKLEKKRQEILAMYARDLRSGQEASDDNTDDLVDRANNAISRELMFALSDSERGLLLQVEEALLRIDNGAYGRCVHCGQPIAAQRLDALPWAKYCIDCQEMQEKGLLEEA